MNSSFLNSNSYFVDEKVNLLKFENAYNIYNDQGVAIGTINQKLNVGEKILRLFVEKKMLPFLLEIRNAENGLESTVSRGFALFLSKTTIRDGNGNLLGTIRQKFTLLKPKFMIYDASEKFVAEINGDFIAWEFKIRDANNNPIGTISKNWAGGMKEFFTTADKYNVSIDPNYSNRENKITILSAAITIDMVLKENN